MLPVIRSGPRSSHLWRGIVSSWGLIDRNISWVIWNGQAVRFWQDVWVPGLGPLSDHLDSIPEHEWNFSVASYASMEGWN